MWRCWFRRRWRSRGAGPSGPVQEHRGIEASSAAPIAIRAICQPGMPPVTTVRIWVGEGATPPASRGGGSHSEGSWCGCGEGHNSADEPGYDAGQTADALDEVHDGPPGRGLYIDQLPVCAVSRRAAAIRRSTDSLADAAGVAWDQPREPGGARCGRTGGAAWSWAASPCSS